MLNYLLSFLEQVTGFVDNGDSVDVIFLDFAKAFDNILSIVCLLTNCLVYMSNPT